MLWVGIDEAGYGPNLGPLVMSAVVAEGPDDRRPDVWGDLPDTICRAGGPSDRLWVDDSKAVYKNRTGRDRLDEATAALVGVASADRPSTFGGLLAVLNAGTLDEVELSPWIDADPPFRTGLTDCGTPFAGAAWRIVAARSVVVGPARFNDVLSTTESKALVHFQAFIRLLEWVRSLAEATAGSVEADKHGGRHYYGNGLSDAFPDAWVERGEEGPALSRYVIRDGSRRVEIALRPRADAENGFVALASMLSKSIRESWMEAFNAFWTARIPGLKPTAGYPVDARRFRLAIEPECRRRGLDPSIWWRNK